MQRWRNWNYEQSLKSYEGIFGGRDEDAISGYKRSPYAWWALLLIPIAGIAYFYGVAWTENLDRRRMELEKRRSEPETTRKAK